jgi:hypothetical protein
METSQIRQTITDLAERTEQTITDLAERTEALRGYL